MPVRLIAIIALVLAAILTAWHWRTSAQAPHENPIHPTAHSSPEASRKNAPVSPQNPATKSHQRPDPPVATLSQTLQLLERTLPGEFELPEESFTERIDRLNRIFAEAGIPASELIVVPREGLLDELSRIKFAKLRMVDPTGFELLRYTADITRVHFRPLPGRVEFCLATDEDPTAAPHRPSDAGEDPFGLPGERTEPRPPREPGDPFGP